MCVTLPTVILPHTVLALIWAYEHETHCHVQLKRLEAIGEN